MFSRSLYLWLLPLSSLLIYGQSLFAEESPSRIAVLELVKKSNTNISRDEVSFLTDEVRRVVGYLPTDRFLVMTKESMAVMIEPGKTLEECVGQCEVETGRMLNADWIITGELLKFGSSLRASLRLHNTQTGQFVKGESLKGKSVEDLEESIRLSTLRIIHVMDPKLKQQLEAKVGRNLNRQLEVLRSGTLNPVTYVKSSSQEDRTQVSRQKREPSKERSDDSSRSSQDDHLENSQDIEKDTDEFSGITIGVGLMQGTWSIDDPYYMGTSDGFSLFGTRFDFGYRFNKNSHIKGAIYTAEPLTVDTDFGYGNELEYMDEIIIEGAYFMYSHSLWLTDLLYLNAGLGYGTVYSVSHEITTEEFFALETGIGVRFRDFTLEGNFFIIEQSYLYIGAGYTF